MIAYLARRLGAAVIVLFVISMIDFLFINLAPGNPIEAMVPAEAVPRGIPKSLYAGTGLNQSIPVRYVEWLGSVFHGNLGTSFETHTAVAAVIGEYLKNTLLLMGAGLLVTLAIGIPIGVIAGLRAHSAADNAIQVASFTAFAIPAFFLALLAVFLFAVRLAWFPAVGMTTPGARSGVLDLLWHLCLPALVLGVLNAPVYVRYVRSSVIRVLARDHIRAAIAKGLPQRVVLWRHILPNALSPVITVLALHLPTLVGGAYLIEFVFGWPGLGYMSIQAASFRDYPLFMGTALLVAAAVVISNLLADILYAVLDPRVRL